MRNEWREISGSIPLNPPNFKNQIPMSDRIESKTARAVLNLPDRTVEIGGMTYGIAKPTLGTLIMVSGLAAELPVLDGEDIFKSAVTGARDCGVLAKIVAVLILGAKRVSEERTETVEIQVKRGFSLFHLFGGSENATRQIHVLEVDHLSEKVAQNLSVSEIKEIIVGCVLDLGIADFFAVTTSLAGTNLLRPKEVGETK